MAKNAKLSCLYCPNDTQIASHNLLKHTLSKHFDVFLCGTNPTSKNNREALKRATKFNPVELKFYSPTYYCCFKCNSASVKEASCRHWHFNTEDDAKNHKHEHLQGCKDLLQKVVVRMEQLNTAQKPPATTEQTPATTEQTPTGDATIVYRDRIVEKVVYKDRLVGDINSKVILDALGALIADCHENNFMIAKLEKYNDYLQTRLLDADETTQRKDLLITKLQTTSTLSPFQRKLLESECYETNVIPNKTALRLKLAELEGSIKRKDDYDPYDKHEDILNELKVYIPNLTLSLINRHLPKDDNNIS